MKILTVNSLLNVGPLIINGSSRTVADCGDCGQIDRWTDCQQDPEYICLDCFNTRQLVSTYSWHPLITRVTPIVVECNSCQIPFNCPYCNGIPPTGNISCFFKAADQTQIDDIILCATCKSLWDSLQCFQCNCQIQATDLYSNISVQATMKNLKYGHSIAVKP